MTVWRGLAAAVACLLCGCGGRPGTHEQTTAATFHGPCPVSRLHVVSQDIGAALGEGPVYPVGPATLRAERPARFASHRWGGQKVLWVRRPGVHGDVTITGHRLDGPEELRFDRGDVPAARLVMDESGTTPAGWPNRPSYTRISAPGCYAYDVRGRGVRERIVFRFVLRS